MDTKNAEISLAILDYIHAGQHIADAVDAVLGAGTFESVIDEVYDTLRQRYEELAN